MSGLKQVHPTQPVIRPGGDAIEIDVEMVPLIRRLWTMGLETKGCCQDFGDSILNDGHRTTSPGDARRRFADFYSGQAWLKMPAQDAIRLLTAISDHPLFADRVRNRTHPGAWMNIVYIFPGDDGADLVNAAQLHFPRVQLPELVAALETT